MNNIPGHKSASWMKKNFIYVTMERNKAIGTRVRKKQVCGARVKHGATEIDWMCLASAVNSAMKGKLHLKIGNYNMKEWAEY